MDLWTPTPPETKVLFRSVEPSARDGLSSEKLVFHTYENHISPGFRWLTRQWRRYELLGIAPERISRVVTGLAFMLHDFKVDKPLDDMSQFASKEQRAAADSRLILADKPISREAIDEVVRIIPLTALGVSIDPEDLNGLLLEQTDLSNTWSSGYKHMAANAHRIHKEDENLKQEHIPFKDHQEKVSVVLGTYLGQSVAIHEADLMPDSNKCYYNVVGLQNLNNYLHETPASLAALLGIDVSEVV